jgi:hypothetical protein
MSDQMRDGPPGARTLADLMAYVRECEEARELLEFANTTPVEIAWHPERGESLRDALRKAKRASEAREAS